jgi:glycosyltransferase involved in cell wall biosynthesis
MSNRILLVMEATNGGVARHVIDLALSLAGRGHDVHVIYSPLRADYEMLAPLVNDQRISTTEIPIRRNPGFRDMSALLAIRRYIAAHGPFDIVHGHSTKGALGCLAAFGKRIGRVYTAHGMRSIDPRLKPFPRFVIGTIERLIMRLAHLVIPVSSFEEAHCVGIGVAKKRLRVVNNGVDPAPDVDRAAVRARFGLSEEHVAVGYAGRLSSEKGPDRILDAFHDASEGNPAARLVMIGYGPMEAELKQQAETLGLGDRVIWVNEGNGRGLMPAFDIYTLPSAYEGMPYVLIEAVAAGLPVVATDVGGARTLVEDGQNGFVVANWDRAAFAGRIRDLLADEALRARMAASSKSRAGDFSLDRMVDETLAVYAAASNIVSRGAPVSVAGASLPKGSPSRD